MSLFVRNPAFEVEFTHEPRTIEGMALIAEAVKEIAKATAPFDPGAHPHYRDSLGIVVAGSEIYVNATDFKAWWIEYGTARGTPVFAPIRRAVKESGLRLIEHV